GCSVVLLIIAIVSFRNSEKIVDSSQWVAHTHEVLGALQQVLVDADEALSMKRGFIITGDDAYLMSFDRSMAGMNTAINDVHELTKDNPQQQRNAEKLSVLADTLSRLLAANIDVRRSQGFEQARQLMAGGEEKRIMNELRTILSNARAMEEKLLLERSKTSETDARSFSLVFIVLLATIATVLVIVYAIIISNLAALRKLQQEAEVKNWSLTGSAGLNRAMQGNKLLPELTQQVINHLTQYVGAQTGIIFIADEAGTQLLLTAGYATGREVKSHRALAWGEGLAGQCAAEKKSILVRDIPGGKMTLHTGFGSIPPHTIMALPILFEGNVVGVAELGSVHDFTERQKEYLELVMDMIGIGIFACQSREKAKDLLEETQRQSEELNAQQEELKQSNETLQEKNRLLEDSEAELKTQQEELQQTNEELEEKANLLEEQKDRLETARTALETKGKELELTSRYKSEFLANMSHELRTPLNSILILAQLLKENKHQVLGQREIEYAGNIFNSGTDLLNLINEILDLSKVEAGKIELDISEMNMGEVADHLRSMFGELAKTKHIRFDIQYNPDQFPHAMQTDRQRVEQILRNLLSNAFKFTPKGGQVFMQIEKTAPAGKVNPGSRLLQQPEVIAFTVTDSGIGIPADKQEIIFQAFQQADGSTKRKYGGTGLGLSISRELAFALGGEIGLQSEEGKGSSFTLYLPLHFAGAATADSGRKVEIKQAAEKKSVPDIKTTRRETYKAIRDLPDNMSDDRYTLSENDRCILVIEDDTAFAKVILQFLRERGYKGIVAEQGNTGLSLARYYRPDAIILDMQLPVMDGAEVLRHLKNDPELRHIPVQIFSGYDRRKESMELGAF
ncbi:MAG: CHASE3 domain-containing protein, partial [Bacteroidetes bacterium]|nr:CHASE3 domain-containing protein [Bacteroidota bacterium]